MTEISVDVAVEIPCRSFVAAVATLSATLIFNHPSSEQHRTKLLDRIDRCLDEALHAYEDKYC